MNRHIETPHVSDDLRHAPAPDDLRARCPAARTTAIAGRKRARVARRLGLLLVVRSGSLVVVRFDSCSFTRASAEHNRRVGRLVSCPPLPAMAQPERRQCQEALPGRV